MEILALVFFVAILIASFTVLLAGLIKTYRFERECGLESHADLSALALYGAVAVSFMHLGEMALSVTPFIFVLRHARDWRDASVIGVYANKDSAEIMDRHFQTLVKQSNGQHSYMPTIVESVSIDDVFRDYGSTGNDPIRGFLAWADTDVQSVVGALLGDDSALVDEIAYTARQIPLLEEVSERLFDVTGNGLEFEIHIWLDEVRDDLLEALAKDRRVLEYLLTEHCESIPNSFGQYTPDRILDLVGRLGDLETLTMVRDLLDTDPDNLDLNGQLVELWESAYEHPRVIGHDGDWWVADTETIASLVSIGIEENW